jgi:hypothetical protein
MTTHRPTYAPTPDGPGHDRPRPRPFAWTALEDQRLLDELEALPAFARRTALLDAARKRRLLPSLVHARLELARARAHTALPEPWTPQLATRVLTEIRQAGPDRFEAIDAWATRQRCDAITIEQIAATGHTPTTHERRQQTLRRPRRPASGRAPAPEHPPSARQTRRDVRREVRQHLARRFRRPADPTEQPPSRAPNPAPPDEHWPGPSSAFGRSQPTLGSASGGTQGFGEVAPNDILEGGDISSEILSVHWRRWGARRAIGTGRAVYVWPGTCIGCNHFTSAKVVAFRLGRCGGSRAYTALEWYFPQYDQVFDRKVYLDACGGSGPSPHYRDRNCGKVHGRGWVASGVSTGNVTCRRARLLILRMKAGGRHTLVANAKWKSGHYRCGTIVPGAVECETGNRYGYHSLAWSRS